MPKSNCFQNNGTFIFLTIYRKNAGMYFQRAGLVRGFTVVIRGLLEELEEVSGHFAWVHT